jgi:pectin methylesterase-like acyl-CoA thioesterase
MDKKIYYVLMTCWLALYPAFSHATSTIYDFRDGNIITNGQSDDGKLTLSGTYSLHGSTYGLNMKVDGAINIAVDGPCIVRFLGSQYSGLNMTGTAVEAGDLGTIATKVATDLVDTYEFNYNGAAVTLNFMTTTGTGNDLYLPLLEVIPVEIEEFPSNGKTDVWDFGAAALDEATYNNQLSAEIINAWYDGSIVQGSNGHVFPSIWSAGRLSWTGGGNDRLRTTNTELTRYDESIAGATDYTGRIYVNSGANTGRFLNITLNEDDEVTLIAKTDAGGNIVFEYADDAMVQTDETPMTSDLRTINLVAKEAGNYKIYDNQGKPSYYRIYRKDATYIDLSGAVDLSGAPGIPADYTLVFENEAGKLWSVSVTAGAYQVTLPAGYQYEISLAGANGYILSGGTTLEVTEATTTHDLAIEQIALHTVSGNVVGLGSAIHQLELIYTPDPAADKRYIPEPIIDVVAGTYSVQLEPNCEYNISASGVNDYVIADNSITIVADQSANVVFSAKPLHKINITTIGLTTQQTSELVLTFSNLYEAGYSYTFESTETIELRDGTYAISYGGLDNYPLELGLTSNLQVEGAETSKELNFTAITNWPFNDMEITNATSAYKGLLFSGIIANEIAKGHLTAKPEATIQVPVSAGEKIVVTYYYSADFSFEGGEAITTVSNSTSALEYASYVYTGTDPGHVTITIGSSAGTTYLTNISVKTVVPFESVLLVGSDKPFQTVNAALEALRNMVRENEERVSIVIDPGNYEEMLHIDVPNVSLVNASNVPSIELANSGVDIAENAVRITGYYGHGYSYFSMTDNQKWDADVLRVNKENGYLSYANKGAGTTNGSYWNATVVVAASGFEAQNLIFENSFNQYISQKEAEDVVVMWESGSKGERPVDYGNTSVQDKSFVERAAALAITNNTDKVILNNCRLVGHQDTFFGGSNSRVVVYKGAVMGGTDYIFGGMTAVFYKTNLVLNTSDASSDVAYITAAQQSSGRGYLMYECSITSARPGIDNASTYLSKPGYFGRPWQANTSEVVFYNTNIEKTNFPGYVDRSLILPVAWMNTLGGESPYMYEYGTHEVSGDNNQAARASWSTLLSEPVLTDNTDITTYNFTKGSDGWDPIPALINADPGTGILTPQGTDVNILYAGSTVYVTNVQSPSVVTVYNLNGILVKAHEINADFSFQLNQGFWIVRVLSQETQNAVKVIVR